MIDRGRGVVETEVRAGSYGPVYFIIMSLLTTRNLTQELSHASLLGSAAHMRPACGSLP